VEEVMKKSCALDQTTVLVNEQATLKNIQDLFLNKLKNGTRPGDTVFVFWSGHGGRCADDNGDEPDGYDEYLVPYDGRLDDSDAIRGSMLLDDTFGRWMQELDGRRLVLLLDTCHSGGMAAEGGKGLKGAKGVGAQPRRTKAAQFDSFMQAGLRRLSKDVGQKEIALLCSSKGTQLSFERREGDLSVMTHFLVKQLGEGQGALTLARLHERLGADVTRYVEEQYPGSAQTPVLVDQTTPPLYVRP